MIHDALPKGRILILHTYPRTDDVFDPFPAPGRVSLHAHVRYRHYFCKDICKSWQFGLKVSQTWGRGSREKAKLTGWWWYRTSSPGSSWSARFSATTPTTRRPLWWEKRWTSKIAQWRLACFSLATVMLPHFRTARRVGDRLVGIREGHFWRWDREISTKIVRFCVFSTIELSTFSVTTQQYNYEY